MKRHVVAAAREIAPGERKIVEIEGRQVGIFNVAGEYYALLNRCPHGGAELCKGAVVGLVRSKGVGEYAITRQGEFLRCPWHGWEFEIKTGQSYCEPGRFRARKFEVAVEHGEDVAKGPYVAETYPVSVEDEYVVLTL
jgi:3-phenylpropionate/trans-cinnamate dioxygenase ferredoxin subunit